jgi:DNA replication and repair protein RecF
LLAVSLTTRAFRNLADAEVALGPGLTVVHGHNGAGKTNLLEALFFGLTGRSCRTRRERELIRFGEPLARAEVRLEPGPGDTDDPIEMLASVSTTEGRRRRVDGRDALADDDRRRPAVSVFMPDRLALVKGPPSPRRAHLDRLGAALWPARAAARGDYSRALAQRNALLARIRRGGSPGGLDAWDRELAARAVPLVEARAAAAAELAPAFAATAAELGLEGEVELSYRPKTEGADAEAIAAELAARRETDLRGGFSAWGPHRDEVDLRRDGRSLRRYGSQGQQRVALLSLLFAEREALRSARRRLPLMLLDDVMSELDPDRRERLVELLARGGQSLITTTEAGHVPAAAGQQALAIEAGVVGTMGTVEP